MKEAAAGWGSGRFSSVSACARAYGVKQNLLYVGIVKADGQFRGSGQFSKLLKKSEGEKIASHALHLAKIGYGLSWLGLRLLMQDLLLSIKEANPDRVTGLEEKGQLPSTSFVRRWAERNNLSLKKSSAISKGRAVVKPEDHGMWFGDVGSFIKEKSRLAAALKDPRRVFNQDETANELGVGAQSVLAEVGTDQVYSVTSSTREHVTVSFTVNAAGEVVSPRGVFAGKRNLAVVRLKDLPKNGNSGEWKFSYTENGWVKQEVFLDIILDLGRFIKDHNITTPVLLFIDGVSCHISLAISQLCDKLGIQPILLRPNTTHLTQPLDLTFYSSLKSGMKREKEQWHRRP